MRPYIIFRYAGFVLLLNAFFLFVSSLISAYYSDTALQPLLYSALVSALFGVFPLIFVPAAPSITNKEGFVIVVASWLLSCIVGIMPYILWGGPFTLTNAWFETVSGFSTTGSSILTDIESLPLGLLFWRAATHWIGGIGIIIFALSVLPSMGRAGMILYRAEMSPLAIENFHFRTKKTLQILLIVYTGLTLLETASLMACGMNWFDALTHSFATIATGGFSPKNSSIAFYHSISIEVVVIIFMVLSGIHFGLLFAALCGKVQELWRSSIVRYYCCALVAGVAVVTLSVHSQSFDGWCDALRYAAFQVISLGTSTGFATTDSSVWPPFARLVLIFLTLQCACAGSTSGGIKTDRIVIFWKSLVKRMTRIKHPHAVIIPKINDTALDEDALEASSLYIILYLSVVLISTLLLTALNMDILSAFSGSAATMGNVGPGFGTVGSFGNFSQVPDVGKWILTMTMLLGRLEIFGLVLFVTAKYWK